MDKTALANRFEGYSKIFASENPMGIDILAIANTIRGMNDKKFASIINPEYKEEEACEKKEEAEEKEAFVAPGQAPYGDPGGAFSRRQPMSERYTGIPHPSAKMTPEKQEALAKKYGIPSEKLRALMEDWSKAEVGEEVMASETPKDNWTKDTFDHVASALVRDVLGMTKTVHEDTHRHLTKEQMPDAKKAPELKNVRPTEQDTGRALTPEQVPDKSERLDSDIYKKSQGKVRKEATTAEETTDTKAAEPQNVKEPGNIEAVKKEDKTHKQMEKKVEKLEKAQKEQKAEEKAEKRDERVAPKEAEAAQSVVAEGIQFEPAPGIDEIDINDPEIKKLSSLFE